MQKAIDAYGGVTKVREDHRRSSPDCNDASKIRVRAPNCSSREWDKVTRAKGRRPERLGLKKTL
jgi:hypothetical protein